MITTLFILRAVVGLAVLRYVFPTPRAARRRLARRRAQLWLWRLDWGDDLDRRVHRRLKAMHNT